MTKFFKIDDLIAACKNVKKMRLRESFPGEKPDFIQERTKDPCTAILAARNGVAFCIEFNPPIALVAGQGYVFEEDCEA